MNGYARRVRAKLQWDADTRALVRGERVLQRAQRSTMGLDKAARRAGAAIGGLFAAQRVAAALGAATEEAVRFSRAQGELATLLPGNVEAVERLGAASRQIAVEYGASAADLQAASYGIVSAFGDTADSVETLRLVTQAAKAGNTEAATAIDLLSAVTLAYGDTSIETQRKVSDLAFTTVRLGKTTFPELASAVGTVAPGFASLGVSTEELFASMTALAGVTGSTSEASTQLSAISNALLKRTKDMDRAFAELGVSSAEALVQQYGLVGAIQALAGTTDGSAEALAKLFTRVRALRAAQNLTQAGAQRFSGALREMGGAGNATAEAFERATTGVGALATTADKRQARIEELGRTIGERVAGPLGEAKIAALGLAEAVSRDMTDALDVFASSASSFDEGPGGQVLRLLTSTATGLTTVGRVGAAAVGSFGEQLGALGAAGVTLATGDASGAAAIMSARARSGRAQTEAVLSDVRFLGQQIVDPEAARARAQQLRELRAASEAAGVTPGRVTRGELDAIRREAFASSGAGRAAGAIGRLLGGARVDVSEINIAIGDGSSADTVERGVRRGLSSGIGDLLGALTVDQTQAPGG